MALELYWVGPRVWILTKQQGGNSHVWIKSSCQFQNKEGADLTRLRGRVARNSSQPQHHPSRTSVNNILELNIITIEGQWGEAGRITQSRASSEPHVAPERAKLNTLGHVYSERRKFKLATSRLNQRRKHLSSHTEQGAPQDRTGLPPLLLTIQHNLASA